MASDKSYGVATAVLEIEIATPPARVWAALVYETTYWWSKDFYTSPSANGFHIQARLGGLGYEDWGEGNGQVWFTVTAVDAEKKLAMMGHLSPAFGGPAMTMLEITLEATNAGTTLKISDTVFGSVSSGPSESFAEGWRLLFGGLKKYVEKK